MHLTCHNDSRCTFEIIFNQPLYIHIVCLLIFVKKFFIVGTISDFFSVTGNINCDGISLLLRTFYTLSSGLRARSKMHEIDPPAIMNMILSKDPVLQ